MKIAVAGNYGSTNAGDDLYLYLLRKRYPEHEFIFYHFVRDEKIDFAIFGGGGILSPTRLKRLHFMDKRIHARGIPFCTMSIGSVGTRKKIPCLPNYESLKNSVFITVRDRFAHEELSKISDKVHLLPDIAWSYKPPVKKVINEKFTIGVMLRDCGCFNKANMIKRTIKILRSFGLTIPIKLLFFNVYGEKLEARTCHKEIGNRFKDVEYVPHHNTLNMPSHLENYNRCDFVFVMAYHGIIMSILYGVPCSGWIYETKIMELIEKLGFNMAENLGEASIIEEMFQRSITEPVHGGYYNNDEVAKLIAGSQKHYQLLDKYLL